MPSFAANSIIFGRPAGEENLISKQTTGCSSSGQATPLFSVCAVGPICFHCLLPNTNYIAWAGATTIVVLFDDDGVLLLNAVHTHFSALERVGQEWVDKQVERGIRTVMYGGSFVRNREHPKAASGAPGTLGRLYLIMLMKHFLYCGLDMALAGMRGKTGMTRSGLSVGGHKEREVKLDWLGNEVIDIMTMDNKLIKHFASTSIGSLFDMEWEKRITTWDELCSALPTIDVE